MPGRASQERGSENFEDQGIPFAPPAPPRRGHLPGESRAEELLVEVLSSLESGRQAIVDQAWARMPLFDFEFVSDPSGAGTVVATRPTSRNLFLVKQVVAVTPTAATGVTLQLGSVSLPLPGGLQAFAVGGVLLNTADTRRLSMTAGGVLSLLLTGEQVPLFGKVR